MSLIKILSLVIFHEQVQSLLSRFCQLLHSFMVWVVCAGYWFQNLILPAFAITITSFGSRQATRQVRHNKGNTSHKGSNTWAYWGNPLWAKRQLSFPYIKQRSAGLWEGSSFMVPSFTSVAVNSSRLLAQDVAEKPEALYFPSWQFFGCGLLLVHSTETVLPRVINDLLLSYQLWSPFCLDHSQFLIIWGLYRSQGFLSWQIFSNSTYLVLVPCYDVPALSHVVRI